MKLLQLPQNKLARLAINVVFIPFWFLITIYPLTWINYLLEYLTSDYGFEFYLTIKGWIELLILLIPILIFTRFIWFGRILPRPRITRSKED